MTKFFLSLFMIVTGDEYFGYGAKYCWDENYIWATTRKTAIAGCYQRWVERHK